MSSASPFRAPDVRLLFVTRAVRLFAYGFLALFLWEYLAALGTLTAERIGLLLTMTLLGDVAVSLWITTTADRVGRKLMLIVGAILMALAGAVFLSTDNFYILLAAATIGVISPSGNDVGPFLAIEQATLAQVVTNEQRTRVFAWYNLTGSLATAFGALLCGRLVQFLQEHGFTPLQSYHVVLWYYAGTGVLLALLFLWLSPTSEVVVDPPPEGERPQRSFLGLGQSRGVVLRLSALFALDAFAGGFVLQSIMVHWFQERFHPKPATLGDIFWAANFLAGFSALAAAGIAKRVGLLNTMIFTHAPSNVLLILVPFMPTLWLAAGVLLLRFAISQMDVPARQSYTAAVVRPDERSAAAGVTGVARTAGAALSPFLVGLLVANPVLIGAPFVVSGALKLVYDGLLYWRFVIVKPGEPPA